jgi:glycosyltransferase involved in cell wall biosynthesis
LPRKLYARLTAQRLKALERRFLKKFDGHFVVSDRDRATLLKISPNSRIYTADNGVDCSFYADESIEKAYACLRTGNSFSAQPHLRKSAPTAALLTAQVVQRNRILFVGSMDYHANADAVGQFAREVWPAISHQFPQLIFTIVGRNPSREIRDLARLSAIEVTGTVDDVRPYYKEALAAVVPLRVGGGSRLKILEAMAAGVPVVSTRLGAEGLEINDGESVLLAESAEDFNLALAELISKEDFRQSILQKARILARQRYDWTAIGKVLFDSYDLLLKDARSSASTGKTVVTEAFEVSA